MTASPLTFNDFVIDEGGDGDPANVRVEAVWMFSGWRCTGCISMLFKGCHTL